MARLNAPPAPDPCTAFELGLERLRTQQLTTGPGNIEDRIASGIPVATETIFRALASVTEAISNRNQGVQFSLLSQWNVQASQFGARAEPCTRPGNEVLIPWTAGTNGRSHTSLYVVRRTTDNLFALNHFDSARGNYHRQTLHETGDIMRATLTTAVWSRGTTATVNTAVPTSENAARQLNNWECGIHVVLYGWAYALGLTLSNRPLQGGQRYIDFLKHAGEIINLSMLGSMDSTVIKDFMECYGFIQAGQGVSGARSFARSVRIERNKHYLDLIVNINAVEALEATHAAKSRIDDALLAIGVRENRQVPDVAGIKALLVANGETMPDLDMTTAEELLIIYDFWMGASGAVGL